MSAEANQAIVLYLMEEFFNKKDETVWDKLVDAEIVVYSVSGIYHGTAAAKAFYMNNWFRAFPDLYFAIDDVITQEDKVVLRLIESGTMTGGLMNFRPTGRKFTLDAAQICRLASGKLIEIRDFRDTASLLRQLKVATTLTPALA